MDSALMGKLEKAAEFIIETGARETTTGHHYIYPEEIPPGILTPGLFNKHVDDIIGILKQYEAIGDIEVMHDGTVDMIVYLNYCPNYEPDTDERDDYPDAREILDPLKSRAVPKNTAKPLGQAAPGTYSQFGNRQALRKGDHHPCHRPGCSHAGARKSRQTLMGRLAENRLKAARQRKTENTEITRKRGARE